MKQQPPIFQILCPETQQHLRIYADGRVEGWSGQQTVVINLIPHYLHRASTLFKEDFEQGRVPGNDAPDIFPSWSDGWFSPDLLGQAFGIGCKEEMTPERALLMLREHSRQWHSGQHQERDADGAVQG